MTTRTQTLAWMGAVAGDASDVALWSLSGAADAVEATHEAYPTPAELVATEAGARLHLLGFADTAEGSPATAATPAIPATGGTPPDYEGALTLAGTRTVNQNVGANSAFIDRTDDQFIAFPLTIPASPSGVIYEQGNAGDGAYVGFVGGELVVRNGTGADLRYNATNLAGKTGTLYVAFTPSAGSVSAWWITDGDAQTTFIGTGAGTAVGDWAAGGGGRVFAVNGTANNPDDGGVTPTIRDSKITETNSASFSATMPTHVAGDTLLACVTMHPSSGSAFANISGWEPVVTSAVGNAQPGVFLYKKVATSAAETCPVSCSGGSRTWEKSVTTIAVENGGSVIGTIGQQLFPTTDIDFAAGAAGAGLYLRMLGSSNNQTITMPAAAGPVFSSHDPYLRAQEWSSNASDAAIANHPVASSGGWSTLTVSLGDSGAEGTTAFNGTLDAPARFYENTPVPGNIDDVGTFSDPGTPADPGSPATPYTPGSIGAAWAEKTAGRFLENVRARLAQSRSGAGLWSVRLFGRAPDGEVRYGPPLVPPTDVASDGTTGDRYLAAQPAVFDGTLWDDLVSAGWAVGLLLETTTEDADQAFGEARLDIAAVQLNWAAPPDATLIYPADADLMTTVQPAVGWTLAQGDTQSAYHVRAWTDAGFDANDPDAGVLYDSGRISSESIRSHQITLPLPAGDFVYVGVRVDGELVNGRYLEGTWQTARVQMPAAETGGAVLVTDNGDGTVTVDGPAGFDWYHIERNGQPIAGLREVTALPWIDHNPPQSTQLDYTVTGILEPSTGTFEATATASTAGASLTLTGTTWRLSTLDGATTYDVQLEGASRAENRATTFAPAALGGAGIASTAVLSGSTWTLRVVAIDAAEVAALRAVIESNEAMVLRDLFGGAWFVRLGGQVTTTPIGAAPLEAATAAMREVYRVNFVAGEIIDPRDLDFGRLS